jgi:DNA-binding transcriptional regulator YiaG
MNTVIDGEGMEHSRRVAAAALGVFQQLLGFLQCALEGKLPTPFSWMMPSLECRYPVSWSWTDDAPIDELPLENSTATSPPVPLGQLEVFNTLTHGTGWKISDGLSRPLVTAEQKAVLEGLPKAERRAMLDEITEPFTLIVTRNITGGDGERRNLFFLPTETVEADVDGIGVVIGLRFEVHPLTVDSGAQRAYYPVIISLEYSQKPKGLGAWLVEHGHDIWVPLAAAMDRLCASLEAIRCQESDATARQESVHVADRAPGNQRIPEVGARITFPEQRRSVMSPVPMPRAVGREASTLAGIRGLGRMFAGYAGVPDLDINGAIAVAEARRSLLATLEEHLAARGARYQREEEGTRVIYTIRNCRADEAAEIWATVERAMNKGDGGPGIEARPPAIEGASRFEDGAVVTESKLVFWPENSQQATSVPAVHFRSQSSPGYLALLDRRGRQPYFADGWLWIQRGREREGFRIGGLSTLLFPEGRSALERMAERQIADREAELNRMIQAPQLFGDPDQKEVQELRAGVTRLRKWLAGLSVFDVSHDLILCLLEGFYRQRDHWARQEIVLKAGVVSIAPYRILLLDPKELRLRLDPSGKWGDNWRARLFDRFSALATFERQTRTATGRKVDVGDRLIHRVIDGLRSPQEAAHPESDPAVGLVRLLRQVGALPSDMFYIEVSVDFMAKLVTWAVEENGAVRWGLEAVSDSPARECDSGFGLGRQPYYRHSPRLLALSNLEDWPVNRKLLASSLLQEMAPARRRGSRGRSRVTVQIDDRPYLACNGAGGHGYKIRTWMERSGHDLHGTGGRSLAQFIADIDALVETLNLRIEVGEQRGDCEVALRELHALAADPEAAVGTMLRAYLPADLEERLRAHLAEWHIEACESGEEAAGVMSASDLRSARLQAGSSQRALARAIGVSKMAISHWERGTKSIPPARILRIREVLEGETGQGSKPQVTKSHAK